MPINDFVHGVDDLQFPWPQIYLMRVTAPADHAAVGLRWPVVRGWAATTGLSATVSAQILLGGKSVIARRALRVCSGDLCTPTCALVAVAGSYPVKRYA